jgi:hypothetical protein
MQFGGVYSCPNASSDSDWSSADYPDTRGDRVASDDGNPASEQVAY